MKPLEQPLSEKLEQLSAAATQGEWRIHGAMLGHRGDLFSPTAKQVTDCHHIARFYAPKPDKSINCELQAIGVEREAIQQIEANAAFVAALVAAYRTGQLVAVQADDAIERVKAENEALLIALHDAIRRPMGVVPASADQFYSPVMADQAEAIRALKSPKPPIL